MITIFIIELDVIIQSHNKWQTDFDFSLKTTIFVQTVNLLADDLYSWFTVVETS